LTWRDSVARCAVCARQRAARWEFCLSRGRITDIEMGRYVPGPFKVVSLAEIYGVTIDLIQRLYGIHHGDISKERPVFLPPRTHIITRATEDPNEGRG